MIVQKRLGGHVICNDGEFAEIETFEIEGPDYGLLRKSIDADRYDLGDSPENSSRGFPSACGWIS
jgi:hypothetical protein